MGRSGATYDGAYLALPSGTAGTGKVPVTTGSGSATSWQTIAANMVVTAVKTSNYTAAAGEYVPVDTTSGAVQVTLPAAPAEGTVVIVKRVAGVTNNATVVTGGSDVFNTAGGATTATVSLLNMHLTFTYDTGAAIWYVETSIALTQLDARFAPLSAASSIPRNTQTGVTYTAVLGDAGKVIRCTNASAVTVTIPPNSSVAYPTDPDTVINIYCGGAGGLTISPGVGVTIRNNTVALAQYQEVSLRKDGTDEWVRSG